VSSGFIADLLSKRNAFVPHWFIARWAEPFQVLGRSSTGKSPDNNVDGTGVFPDSFSVRRMLTAQRVKTAEQGIFLLTSS